MRPAYALGAPLWFLRSAAQDPVSLIVLAGASVYAVARLREGNAGFAPAYFVLAAVLWFIFLGWLVHLWSILDAAMWKPKGVSFDS